MKLEKVKSLFSNGEPYIKIEEPFRIEDFDIVVNEPKDRSESEELNFDLGRSFGGSVAILLKSEVVEYIKGVEESLLNIFQYNDYFSKEEGDRFGQYKSVYSKDIKFTGLRGKERKRERYIKRFNDFSKKFNDNSDNLINELISDVNERLKNRVSNLNDEYKNSHKELFTSTKYEHVWEDEFKSNERYDDIEKRQSEIEKQINELKSKMNSLKEEERELKVEISKEKVDKYKLPQDVKQEILDKLNSGEAWKEQSRMGFFR